jgi:hypothetical protein
MQRAAVEQAGMDIKSRQMQFETARFTLDQAREEAARKRNMFSDLAKLNEEILPLMQDPTIDNVTRKNIYSQISVKNSALAAINPAVANALNAMNSSISASTQQKDRVTKFDYINNNADLGMLKAYEDKLGKTLGADDEVPIDLLAAGRAKAALDKEERDAERKSLGDREQAQQEGAKELAKTVLAGKLIKPLLGTAEAPIEFELPATKEALPILVSQYGTPEEQKQFQKAKVPDQLSIGQRIAYGVQSGIRIPASQRPTKPSLRSSFTTPSK